MSLGVHGHPGDLWGSLKVFGVLSLIKGKTFQFSHAEWDFLVFLCRMWVLGFLILHEILGFLILHETFCPKHQKTKTKTNIPIWSSLNKFDQIWTNFIYFEPISSILNKFDPVWTCLNKFEQVWTSMNKFNPVWTCLNKIDQFGSSLSQFDPV